MFFQRSQSPDLINVEALRNNIIEGKLLEEQRAHAASNMPVVNSGIELLEGRVPSICYRFQEEHERRTGRKPPSGDPFLTKSDHFIAIVLRIGSVVTMALDVLVSALLAKSWLDIPSHWAAIAGGVVAVLLSFLCKAGILHLAYDPQNPQSTRRRLKVISFVSFGACLLLAGIVLLSRSPTEYLARYILSLLSISLSLLGLFFPLLAGALMAAAHDFDWSFRYNRDFQDTKMRLGQLKSVQQWMKTLIGQEV